MVKIEAAHTRLFKNVFICRDCKTKIRADPRKIITGRVRCRKCKSSSFRQVKAKKGK
ncbi:hypothetical protein HYV49_00895 [Candidatus Pacearchaeota archaeon]|nr:hypothetical protein [Candidatus Pacearchaeota archaeon]